MRPSNVSLVNNAFLSVCRIYLESLIYRYLDDLAQKVRDTIGVPFNGGVV